MPVIRSKIDTKSDAFGVNARRMRELLSEVQRLEQMVIAESESKRDKFEARGQLLPRERVARLLDRGSPFDRHRDVVEKMYAGRLRRVWQAAACS